MAFPPIPLDVVTALQQQFPERSPDPTEAIEALMVRAGEARVVRFLMRTFAEQQDNVLIMDTLSDVRP